MTADHRPFVVLALLPLVLTALAAWRHASGEVAGRGAPPAPPLAAGSGCAGCATCHASSASASAALLLPATALQSAR